MTPTDTAASTATEPRPPSPDLERPTLHAYRGVCTALARTTGTDVLLWRVLFIVLAFFNGLGVLLYLVGLVTIPREGEQQSLAERLFRGPHRRLHGSDLVLVVLLALSIGNVVDHGDNVIALAVLAGVVLLFFRGRTTDTGEVVSAPPLVRPAVPAPMDPLPEFPGTVTAVKAPRPKSVLGTLTLGVATFVTSILVLIDATDVATIHAETILAVALAVVGAGIVASAWWGRSWVLVPVAILLGLALAVSSVARPAIDAGVGDRTWTPTGAATYRLGVGEATLDLRDVTLNEATPTLITAKVDVGHLIIVVPEGLRVALHAEAKWGDLHVLDQDSNGRAVTRDEAIGPQGSPQVRIDASVRAGQVEVRRG
ncbi:MAG: phage shock protein PspC [Frankiales bacterium]|nr:phage shock protein PspC [Frankiales bacterium]